MKTIRDMYIEQVIEDFVVDLSFDNGGMKPTASQMRKFIRQKGFILDDNEENRFIREWCRDDD